MDFQRDWNRCSTNSRRIQYLQLFSSPLTATKSIFSVEMDAIILCDIIKALSTLTNENGDGCGADDIHCSGTEDYFVLKWIFAIPECGGFSFNIAFFGESEKKALKKMFSWLDKKIPSHNDVIRDYLIADSKESAGYFEEDLNLLTTLRSRYQMQL